MHHSYRLFSVGLLAAALAPAWGMSCARQPLASMVQEYDHIFVAQVKAATLLDNKSSIDASFEVEAVFKGQPKQVGVIRSPFSDYNYQSDGPQIASIPAELSPGMHLLVFAKGNGPAEFSACSATTRLLRKDDARLAEVRNALTGARPDTAAPAR